MSETRAQLNTYIDGTFYNNTSQLITGNDANSGYKKLIAALVNSNDDANVAGGYMKIDNAGLANISFIKAATPSGKFLRDDGTWSASALVAPALSAVLASGNTTGANDVYIDNAQKINFQGKASIQYSAAGGAAQWTNSTTFEFIRILDSGGIEFGADAYFDNVTVSRVPYFNSSGKLVSSAVTPTQLGYLDATSSIQTQLNAITSAGYITASSTNTLTNKSGNISMWTNNTGYVISSNTPGGELAGTYATPTLVNSAVIGKVLTGLNITGSTISASDSILGAFGKVQNQINGLLGGAIYKGVYNANTNSPTLVDGTGTAGYYYVVSVAGNQNFGSGTINFNVGDWTIYNGTIWQKVDNTDAVTSVNGYIGAVSLVSSDISESGNLYFTNARAIAATLTGYSSGAGTISASDSILGAIQKLNGNIAAIVSGVSSVFSRTGAVTAQSGDYNTSQVTEVTNLYFTNARAIAATLTGYSSGAGTISASDSILGAIQKLNGNGAAYGLLANPLSQFASTTSAQLASVLSDETGTGYVVYSISPALTGTPTAPTASQSDNSTKIATTAYVDTALDTANQEQDLAVQCYMIYLTNR